MRKLFLFIVVLCGAFSLSACQIYKDFIVRNASDKEIIVEYTLKESGLPPHESLLLPQALGLADNNSWFVQKKWKPMSPEKYDFDDSQRKFILKLNPDEEVIIEREDSYFINKDGEKAIDLKDLRIIDNGKEVYFENSKRLLEEFKKNDFEIIYK